MAYSVQSKKALELLISLQLNHGMYQSGVKLICETFEALLHGFASDVQLAVSALCSRELASKIQLELNKLLLNSSLKDVNTEHKVITALKKHCGMVEPREISLGDSYTLDASAPGEEFVRETTSKAYIVPFKENLEALMQNNELCSYLIDSPERVSGKNGFVSSYRDGLVWKSNDLCITYPGCLIIQLYLDDLEIVNPLGSRVKTHKLTNVYWMILNYPEHLRSSLKAVNLLAIAKAEDVKKLGYGELLKDFFSCLQKLESRDGLSLVVRGEERRVHGTLLTVNGDNLALNQIGGFKESFGFALKPCRLCNLTKVQMTEIFTEENLRTLETHKNIVQSLKDACRTRKEIGALSRDTGVNSESVFIENATNFDMIQGLVPDLMHNLLEGVVDVVLRATLNHILANDSNFTLEELNFRLESFNYPEELKSTKPSKIEPPHLDNKLRQSASQMSCLLIILPFILAPFKNSSTERALDNLGLLVQISHRLLAYEVNENSIPQLKFMILTHHTRFKNLFPDVNVTPKFHFLVHAPSNIKNFGPSRISWCMRYESLNAWFSKNAQCTKNFKNVTKSLSTKFQMKRCLDLGLADPNVIYLGDRTFSFVLGQKVKKEEYRFGEQVSCQLGCVENELQGVASITVNNFTLRVGTTLLYKKPENLEFPLFGTVCALFVNGKTCAIVLNLLDTNLYDRFKYAFKVSSTKRYVTVKATCLPTVQPFPLFKDFNESFVLPLYFDMNTFDG